jgi:hypothetical protein
MHRVRTAAAAAGATIAGLAGLAHIGPAAAAGDPVVGKQVLDLLCTAKGGAPVFAPNTIGRCQEARATHGFLLEALVCEGLLDGAFASVPSPGRPSRVNWFCFRGPLDA